MNHSRQEQIFVLNKNLKLSQSVLLIGLSLHRRRVVVGKLELKLLPTENCQPSYELGDLMASFIDRGVDVVIVTKGGALHNRAVGVAMFRDVIGDTVGREMD